MSSYPLPWNKVNRDLLVFLFGTIYYFIRFCCVSPYLCLPQGNLSWDNSCPTSVADAATAREHQKPPVIIALCKICSQGHRSIMQAWVKATGAWAYHSEPSPSPPSLACALPPLSFPSLIPLPPHGALLPQTDDPFLSPPWDGLLHFSLASSPGQTLGFSLTCAVEVSWPGSQGFCLNPLLQRDLDKSA